MSKVGKSILAGARQALAYAEGDRAGFVEHKPDPINVKAIREKLGLSQSAFAGRFGVSLRTVQGWEIGARQPTGAARTLLRVVEREPEAVRRALAGQR
ncbi:helix-turn-helix domain-containing protein [Zavarzinia compransoris]|uniref:Transcriptional regulator n=1 Tax=Zavarzinia compransoris TaxID=1264899 RepID=A0A317E3S6_9PROT|nr:helix-turn-helix domain-containing protein [Zavarzinia compransoris]PWR21687.1 transcriptional regulator [Zavarzinia compransoris]TDP45527.1 Xre family transcriptional regulator [Zavarzinia compransoris]